MLFIDREIEVMSGLVVALIMVAIIFYVIQAYLLYKAGEKAKYENSWFAWIPILNTVMIIQLAGLPIYYVLGMLIPYVNIVISIVIMVKFYRNFGLTLKNIIIAYILMFIPILGLIFPIALMWECAYSEKPYEQIRLSSN